MSLHQFHLNEQVLSHEIRSVFPLDLSTEDFKHARVLRLAVGEHIALIDASFDYFECEIVSFDSEGLSVRITAHQQAIRPLYEIALVQGLAKGDKMETIVRHATEVGVSQFLPVQFARSVVKLDSKKAAQKVQRWQSIAKSAAMQSGQHKVPQVCDVVTGKQLQQKLADFDIVVVFWEEAPLSASLCEPASAALQLIAQRGDKGDLPQGSNALHQCCTPVSIALVIGPEGGLSSDEVSSLKASGNQVYVASLGPTILRTETAGIVAPALMRHELTR